MDHRLTEKSAHETDQAPSADFAFECPITVFKAKDAPAGKQRRIAGIISTDSIDRQNERILQDGLTFDDFIKNGWLNNDHKSGIEDVLGFPERVQQFSAGDTLPDGEKAPANCTWVDGYLLDTPKANAVWDLAVALAKTHRRLGYSVEGEIVSRTGEGDGVIAKAKVRNVAITHCFPGHVRVLASPEAVSRRQYDGPIINVRLASGHSVAGTPNHPVLTQRGWVGLGDLDETSDLVCRFAGDWVVDKSALKPTLSAHDIEDVPPRLDEIFAASRVPGVVDLIRRGQTHDFHGDGADSDVDIVSATGLLRDRLKTVFFEELGENSLAIPVADALAFAARSGVANSPIVVDAPKQSLSCFLANLPALISRLSRMVMALGSRKVSSHLKLVGDMVDCQPAYAVPGGQVSERLASDVGLGDFTVRLGREFLKSAARHASVLNDALNLANRKAFDADEVFLHRPALVERDDALPKLCGDRPKPGHPNFGLSCGVDDLIGADADLCGNGIDIEPAPVKAQTSLDLTWRSKFTAFHAMLASHIKNLRGFNTEPQRDLSGGLPGFVKFERISALSRTEFSGHVYNLESEHGWFFADGITVQNCPVNTEARLEILARSLSAAGNKLSRSMSLTDASGSAGPVKPNVAYTGKGAGQVISKERIAGSTKRKRKNKPLTRSEAVAYVKSQIPGVCEAWARALVTATLNPLGRGK